MAAADHLEEFKMPSLGADMTAGRLVQWLKAPGERLARGDLIAEVDTDKGAIEIEVFTDGVLAKTLVEPGQKVPVGTPLALIERAEAAPESGPGGPGRRAEPHAAGHRGRDGQIEARDPPLLPQHHGRPGRGRRLARGAEP